ncbi:Leucine-rich repeat-containing protein 1 [Halotydeus destructor]|nr:Leucine-rich repeat-containing protein 1 [Halotydeus destructor]
MHLECKVSFVPQNGKHKWCRAKIGVASQSGAGYILISSSTLKEKLKVTDIAKLFVSQSRPLITINFSRPSKELMIECTDLQQVKVLALTVNSLRKGEPISLKLPTLGHLERNQALNCNPTSLSVKGPKYDIRELANQSLLKVTYEGVKLLPKGIWKLSRLSELHLIKCALTEIPERMGNLSASLTFLNLGNNDLKRLPGNLFALRNLKHLSVSSNQLTVIPLEIVLLQSLVSLDLSHNKLRKIPFTITALSQLRDLNVAHNELEYLSHSVMKPTNPKFKLASFDFSGNKCSEQFIQRLSNFRTSADRSNLPTLFNRSASVCLKSLINFRMMHCTLPATVYDYMQINTNYCGLCRRAANGRPIVGQVYWDYNWSSVAMTVTQDGPSRKLPVIAFHCFHCSLRS